MNMIDVIRMVKKHQAENWHGTTKSYSDLWFRPVSWRGSGMAYFIVDFKEHIGMGPGMPPYRASFPNASEILGNWEIVYPDDVCRELKERHGQFKEE